MNYLEITKILEETRDELLEPVDNSSVIADLTHNLFNQGVSLMFNSALIKFAKLEQAKLEQGV